MPFGLGDWSPFWNRLCLEKFHRVCAIVSWLKLIHLGFMGFDSEFSNLYQIYALSKYQILSFSGSCNRKTIVILKYFYIFKLIIYLKNHYGHGGQTFIPTNWTKLRTELICNISLRLVGKRLFTYGYLLQNISCLNIYTNWTWLVGIFQESKFTSKSFWIMPDYFLIWLWNLGRDVLLAVILFQPNHSSFLDHEKIVPW